MRLTLKGEMDAATSLPHRPRSTLRFRILASVAALAFLSLVGSSLSLYRLTDVNRSMDGINRVSIPLGRLFVQLRSDAELYQREFERRLGSAHWSDPRFSAKPIPGWVGEVLVSGLDRAQELLTRDDGALWGDAKSAESWRAWLESSRQTLALLQEDSRKLPTLLDSKLMDQAVQVHTRWTSNFEAWVRNLEWGQEEQDRALRKAFAVSESRVSQLRTGMEVILVVVVSLSLLLLWLGERALRPLDELTRLARAITRRGLRREDKAQFPEIPLSRQDEVSQLAREFHAMATALLERERTVESQNERLEEQNRRLREMGELQSRLQYAERLAALGRMSAQVAHEVRNPLHSIGLEAEMAGERAARLGDPGLKRSLDSILASVDRLGKITENYLTLSRLSSGERVNVDLGEILESVLATYSSAFESKRVRVDWTRAADGALPVHIDRGLVETALGNLVRNALEAVPDEGGRILFTLARTGDGQIRLRIEDNGVGVPESARDKLFTPFFTTRASGTGLGLSFVRKVVDEQGGSIECLSIGAGTRFGTASSPGAIFELRLPEAGPEKTALPPVLPPLKAQTPSEVPTHGEASPS